MTRFINRVAALLLPATLLLCSCNLDGDVESYDAWRAENDTYLKQIDTTLYRPYTPVWAPLNTVYIRRHVSANNPNGLVPTSTSTVKVKYQMEDINGNSLGNSYTVSTGDSVYQTTPNSNIIGFWATLSTMQTGDSVTVIIPYSSAYGNQSRSNIKPYSNLIYSIKLKEIVDYDRPHN